MTTVNPKTFNALINIPILRLTYILWRELLCKDYTMDYPKIRRRLQALRTQPSRGVQGCGFLLTQVQTDSKLTLNWTEIKLGSLKSNIESMHVLVQERHRRSINKTNKNGGYLSIDGG